MILTIPQSDNPQRSRTGAWIVSNPRRRYRTKKLAIAGIQKDARKSGTLTLPPASCEGFLIEFRNESHGTWTVATLPTEVLAVG